MLAPRGQRYGMPMLCAYDTPVRLRRASCFQLADARLLRRCCLLLAAADAMLLTPPATLI